MSASLIDGPYPLAYSEYPELRQSTLAAFDACALSSRFEWLYARGWSTHEQARGTLFHRFAQRALEDLQATGDHSIPVSVALAILEDVLRQDEVDRVCPVCGSTDIVPGVDDEGRRLCGVGHVFPSDFLNVPMDEVADLRWMVAKWAQENAFDPTRIVLLEERVRCEVTYAHPRGGHVKRVLTGKPDVVFLEQPHHAVVLDWKTGWDLPAEGDEREAREDKLSPEGYFQQRLYALLLMRQFPGIRLVTLDEFYVRRGEERRATIRREHLHRIEEDVSQLVERFDRTVHEGLWKRPTPGRHCNWCLAPELCTIKALARGEGRIADRAMAERAAARLSVVQAIGKRETKSLRSYASSHGPVEVRDAKGRRVYGHRATERVERPTRAEMDELMRVTRGKPTPEQIDALYTRKSGVRFDAHRPERPEDAKPAEKAQLAALQGALAEARARTGTGEPDERGS